MNVDTLEQQYTPETIVERIERDGSTSGIRSVFSKIRPGNNSDKPYERIYKVYFPLFVAHVNIQLDSETEKPKSDSFTLGVNAITGSVGRIDRLPAQRKLDVDSRSVLDPVLDETEARSRTDEWVFKYVDRSYRALRMPQYEAEICDRYLLYWLVDRGSFKRSYVINDLTGRKDAVGNVKGIDEYYRYSVDEEGQ